MKNILIALILSLCSFKCLAIDIVGDLDVAKGLAKNQQKNVLVIFGLDKCHYCDVLKKDLSSLKNLDSYVVCYLDSRDHKRLTGKMHVKKWPTSIIVAVGSETEGEVTRVIGYGNKSEYEKWLGLNASVFGDDNSCGCGCPEDCSCRKNGICTCCGDKCNCKK